MNGRRIYHARGKRLGGSSSINGMIFQRGNPLDYERWAADEGMSTWDYAHCLPYFKRMENCLAADGRRPVPRPLRAADARAGAGDQSAVRGVLHRRRAGRVPAHVRRQRLPARRLRQVRPQHQPGPAIVGRARLPAPGDEAAESRSDHAGLRAPVAVRGQARRRGRVPAGQRHPRHRVRPLDHPVRWRIQHPAVAAALGHRQRLRAARARDQAGRRSARGR